MKLNRLLLMAFAGLSIFTSCSSDDGTEAPLGSYDNGMLVLNEGSSLSGSVTYISNDLETGQQDIFNVVNTGRSIGGFVQSMFFYGNKAFIISNGSNKITIVNRYTFEFLAEISTGLSVPRYGVTLNGKAYITNMDSFDTNTDDYLAVIDLESLVVETPIPVNDYAERIVAANGKLYVANGSFGSGDSVTVIDPANGSRQEIVLGVAPNSLEEKDGTLYVLCSGFGTSSKLAKIDLGNTTPTVDEVVFPTSMENAQNLDIEGGKAYFSVGRKVYQVALNTNSVTDSPLFDTGSTSSFIGYGFAVKNDRVYISEAADDFTSDGKIFVYSTTGDFVAEKPVGLGPNGFYFND